MVTRISHLRHSARRLDRVWKPVGGIVAQTNPLGNSKNSISLLHFPRFHQALKEAGKYDRVKPKINLNLTEIRMENATRKRLVDIAYKMAQMPFHGYVDGRLSNIQPIIKHFPKWNIKDADRLWCAAFVYYCCVEAGFEIPYSPNECVTCSLAGCGGWEEFAIKNNQIEYHKKDTGFSPNAGDIIIYDNLFCNQEHDHIGIIVEVKETTIIVAEGNIPYSNQSGIIERAMDNHIRAYIRIPDGYRY